MKIVAIGDPTTELPFSKDLTDFTIITAFLDSSFFSQYSAAKLINFINPLSANKMMKHT